MEEIRNSKNVFTGSANTSGGDIRVGDNFYKSLEYKDILKNITRLEKLLKSAETEEERLEYSVDLNDEKNKLEGLKQDVLQLAETFQKIELNTEPLKLAKQYFDEGNYKEARAVLNAEQIAKKLESIEEKERVEEIRHEHKKQEFAQAREQIANEFLVLAKLTAIDFTLPNRIALTKEYFEKSISANKNTDNLFAYAYFLQENNFFDEAIEIYKEALEIYRNLAKTNPQVYQPYVATTLNNLAVLHSAKNELEDAEKEYQEALEIRRNLAKTNPQVYQPYVAMTLNNLGNLHSAKNELEDAEKEYQEALEIRRNLAKTNPQVYQPYVAMTLNNLAVLHSAKNELEDAEKEYQEALEIYKNLAKTNPQVYQPYVAMTLNNLGNLHSAKNELEDAEKEYQEALEIRRNLAKTNP
ncbi:tetratricopeptide repeat protein, partial [Emticicia fluvialis]|uniref:tetratricopeptide repeat protein n=1 Tax=Emticicia fluvialis TaxID=2974474 RepID=UPI00216580D1